MKTFRNLLLRFQLWSIYRAYEAGKKRGIKVASHVSEDVLHAARRIGITEGREQVFAEYSITKVHEYRTRVQLEAPQKPLLLGARQRAAQHDFPISKIALLPEFIPTDKLPKLTQEQRAGVDWLNSSPSELLPVLTKEQRVAIERLNEPSLPSTVSDKTEPMLPTVRLNMMVKTSQTGILPF